MRSQPPWFVSRETRFNMTKAPQSLANLLCMMNQAQAL
jgi:hypothetical protein